VFYEPAKGHGLPHDPFKAIVAPRPIGWISTQGQNGDLNLAPYSFYNALTTEPHLVWFSSEGEKDSVVFARETGEFVVNLVGRGLAERRPDPVDRRAKLVHPTAQAAAVLEDLRAASAGVRAVQTAGFDAAEVATLRRLLQRVRANLAAPIGGEGAP